MRRLYNPSEAELRKEKYLSMLGGLAIWRGEEYLLNILFADRLKLQPIKDAKL